MRLFCFFSLSLSACTFAVNKDECVNGLSVIIGNRCICYSNWAGERCDEPKNCQNGVLSNKSCICDFGFQGGRCDKLAPGSCFHGSYNYQHQLCFCFHHWEGRRCDTIICANNGVKVNDSACNCTGPYLPPTCSERSDSLPELLLVFVFVGCTVGAFVCFYVGKKRGWFNKLSGTRGQGGAVPFTPSASEYQPVRAPSPPPSYEVALNMKKPDAQYC